MCFCFSAERNAGESNEEEVEGEDECDGVCTFDGFKDEQAACDNRENADDDLPKCVPTFLCSKCMNCLKNTYKDEQPTDEDCSSEGAECREDYCGKAKDEEDDTEANEPAAG